MDEFTVSNNLLNRSTELRARAREDGYLYFRSLLPPDAVLEVRRAILGLCAEAGWVDGQADVMDGVAAAGVAAVEPEPAFMAVYERIQRLEPFHALALHPALLGLFDTLFGEPTLAHPRNIARVIFPQNTRFTTPAHQDYIHIQGTADTWTAWIPLGDCPRELGSLAIMRGSHRAGVFPVHSAYGAGGLGIDTDDLPYEWVGSGFGLGDVVTFHSMTVHKALPNLTPRQLRLSVDYRYQGASQPVTEHSLLPHYARLTWDDIYAGWTSTQHQYYWRRLPLNLVEPAADYHQSAKR